MPQTFKFLLASTGKNLGKGEGAPLKDLRGAFKGLSMAFKGLATAIKGFENSRLLKGSFKGLIKGERREIAKKERKIVCPEN